MQSATEMSMNNVNKIRPGGIMRRISLRKFSKRPHEIEPKVLASQIQSAVKLIT